MTEDVTEIFAVVVEGAMQGPIVMEAEGSMTTRDHAEDRLRSLLQSRQWFRGCIVRLEYESGNSAVLHAMKGTQT